MYKNADSTVNKAAYDKAAKQKKIDAILDKISLVMKVFQKRRKTFYLKRVRNNSLKKSTSIKRVFVFGNIILVVLTALILVGYWSSSNVLGACFGF